MTLALAKPGGWDEEDPLTSDEMNALQSELVKAVDGVGGGTYELSSDLIFDGAGQVRIANEIQIDAGAVLDVDGNVQLGGTTDLTGQFDVESGADINVKTGGELNIQGTGQLDVEAGAFVNVLGVQTFYSGAQLRIDSGAKLRLMGANTLDVENGADLNVKTGGDINLAESASNIKVSAGRIDVTATGEIRLSTPGQLKINDAAFGGYHSMVPLSRVQGQWDPGATSGTWVDNAANGTAQIAFALTLQPGDTLTSVVVNLQGQSGITGHAGLPVNKPAATLVEIDFDGNSVQLASVTDPSANVAAYDATHQISVSGGLLPRLVDGGKRLVLIVSSEGGTNSAAGKLRLLGIGFTGIARVIRNLTLHI